MPTTTKCPRCKADVTPYVRYENGDDAYCPFCKMVVSVLDRQALSDATFVGEVNAQEWRE